MFLTSAETCEIDLSVNIGGSDFAGNEKCPQVQFENSFPIVSEDNRILRCKEF